MEDIQLQISKISSYLSSDKIRETEELAEKIFLKYESDFSVLFEMVKVFYNFKKYKLSEKFLFPLVQESNNEELLSLMATVKKELGCYDEAEHYYLSALRINSTNPGIIYNYALLKYSQKKLEDAENLFLKCIELKPDFENAYYNLAKLQRKNEEFEKSESTYKSLLKLNPNQSNYYYDLGVVQEFLDKSDKALDQYEKAIEFDKEFVSAHWNKSLLLLKRKNFEDGFREYEWRTRKDGFIRFREGIKIWNGESLNNKKILIVWEQGFGDVIQFLRYIPYLKEQNAFVIVESKKEIFKLLQSVNWIDKIILRDDPWEEEVDYQVPIMSLPHLLKIKNENIYKTSKSIFPLNREHINPQDQLRVGIIWRGNQNHQNDKYRSIELENFIPLFSNKKLKFYSLQFGRKTRTEIELLQKYNIEDLNLDFYDLFKHLSSFDLLISVDTAGVHLAGSLNVKTWLLLPANPDWRWGEKGYTTEWYESVKIFRQKTLGCWSKVFEKVFRELNYMKNSSVKSKANQIEIAKKFFIEQRFDQAQNEFKNILNSDPDNLEALNYLGILTAQEGNFEESIYYFNSYLKLKPDADDVICNLGIIYDNLLMFDESLKFFERAVSINPKNVTSIYNLALTYEHQGNLIKAIENYKKVIDLNPNHSKTRYNLSLINLLLENYEDAWDDYELGFEAGDRVDRKYKKPKWDGAKFENKVLYVYSNQGLGDTIQFSRYLPLVKKLGGKIIFECQPELIELFSDFDFIDKIVPTPRKLIPEVEFDLQIPLLSLPGIFNTNIDFIPNVLPQKYFDFPSQNYKNISAKLKVGFCWRGKEIPIHNRKRHLKIEQMAALFDSTKFDLYSLQLNPNTEEKKIFNNYNVIDLTNNISNFRDTAEILADIDLVITIDSAIAHLAGTLNKKTFLMLPFVPDWRWGLEKECCRWYPSLKLFRQETFGNWTEPLNKIVNLLKEM